MALVTSFLPRSWRKQPGEAGVDNLQSDAVLPAEPETCRCLRLEDNMAVGLLPLQAHQIALLSLPEYAHPS